MYVLTVCGITPLLEITYTKDYLLQGGDWKLQSKSGLVITPGSCSVPTSCNTLEGTYVRIPQ